MMVLKIHPKLVDTMLAVAKGEHAVALHNYPGGSPTSDGIGAGDAATAVAQSGRWPRPSGRGLAKRRSWLRLRFRASAS